MKDVLIRLVADSGQRGVCKGCGRAILWFTTLNQRAMPMNLGALPRHLGEDGTAMYAAADAHWGSCPARQQFAKR